ncbi:MAG: rod shape-determining protein MreC [Pseudomonadota bacterium]|nr:rod shape-determining protein MreC [Pseudomonadota bacterium]
MLLTQSLLLKAYFINVSSTIHWYILEHSQQTYDQFKINYHAFKVNKDLLAENLINEKVIEELRSQILIAEANGFVNNQINAFNIQSTKKENWLLAKTRHCTDDSMYVFLHHNPGLKNGTLVIHNYGVVGLIANNCNDKYCLVKLINHKDTSLALNNKNDQISGLMTVNKNKYLTLDYINKKETLMQNEVLYTSGFATEQPAGFPVATVTEKFTDLKNNLHYILTPVESLSCPSWVLIWKTA